MLMPRAEAWRLGSVVSHRGVWASFNTSGHCSGAALGNVAHHANNYVDVVI